MSQQKVYIEILDGFHFAWRYQGAHAEGASKYFIDKIWETKPLTSAGELTELWLPKAGYSFIINLGMPFEILISGQLYQLRHSAFIPGSNAVIVRSKGYCRFFGIDFHFSPVLLQKGVDISEYRDFVYPLTYLIDLDIIHRLQAASGFRQRVEIISGYYNPYGIGDFPNDRVDVLAALHQRWKRHHSFDGNIGDVAEEFGISSAGVQKLFLKATGMSYKRCFQVTRLRSALKMLSEDPESFDVKEFGYQHVSHFQMHLHRFCKKYQIVRYLKKMSIYF